MAPRPRQRNGRRWRVGVGERRHDAGGELRQRLRGRALRSFPPARAHGGGGGNPGGGGGGGRTDESSRVWRELPAPLWPLLTPACLGTRSTLIFHFMLVPELYILRRIPVSVRVQFSRVVLRTVRTLQVESLDGVGYGLWLPESCFECVDVVCANGRNGITL